MAPCPCFVFEFAHGSVRAGFRENRGAAQSGGESGLVTEPTLCQKLVLSHRVLDPRNPSLLWTQRSRDIIPCWAKDDEY